MTTGWSVRPRPAGGAAGPQPRHDAFTGWALETKFRDALLPGRRGPPEAVWLMLELRESACLPVELHQITIEQLPGGWLRLPDGYATPLKGLESLRYCTALATPNFIRFLVDGELPATLTAQESGVLHGIRAAILRYEIALQGDAWVPPTSPAEARPGVKAAVVVGIIDDGIPVAHERLCWRDAKGQRHTRFLGLWNQAAGAGPDSDWGIGTVLDRRTIDQAIRSASDAAGRVDEDAAYARLGLARLLRHRVTHGAHVADLACGMPPPDAPELAPAVVGVQLRPMESTLCISAGAHLFDAVRFIIAQADRAGAEHVVVNASLGNIAGPHNGSSLFESAIDAIVAARRDTAAPVSMVMPEGNSYLSRCHAWAEFDPGQPASTKAESRPEMSLDWCLRPDDGTSSYLEIWLRPVADKPARPIKMSWCLRPPVGPALPISFTITAADPANSMEWVLRDAQGQPLAMLGIHPAPANGDLCMGLLTVAPTAPYGPWAHAAPSGAWTLEIRQDEGGVAVFCNVYSQRDEKSFGHRGRARQAVIEDGFDRVFDACGHRELKDGDSYRRRVGTINGLACGNEVEVAGGLVIEPGGSLAPADYSSVSLPIDGRLAKRRLAVTEDSQVLHGILAAGCRSGTLVALSGTSTAAPQLARSLAVVGPAKPGLDPPPRDHNELPRDFVYPSAEQARRSCLRRGDL